MMIAYLMGNQIYSDDNGETWYYTDTGEKIKENDKLTCPACSQSARNDEPDPCLGYLPGVDNACCGHGIRELAYISFENGIVIRGQFNMVEDKTSDRELEIPDRGSPFPDQD